MYTENPFTEEYFEKEKQKFMSKCKQINNERVSITLKSISGRLNGFLHKDFVDLEDIPIFKIDNKLWMSITPMEVQSHYIPIFHAHGRVGVAGLGLGYYVQSIIEKPEVNEVVVYELEQDVVDLYLENFGPHHKLSFVIGNVLETCKNEEFEWFYNDIYAEMYDDTAFEHMKILSENNFVYDYHFWTMEGYILSATQEDSTVLPYSWQLRYFPFLKMLIDEKSNLVEDVLDPEESCELIKNFKEASM